jgi:hypothetical protein
LVPAGSAFAGDGNGGRSADAKACAAQKKADREAFRATYGKHAMRHCLKGPVDATASEFKNAAKECRAAQEADAAGFLATWGTNSPNGENSRGAQRNAFGKCVAATAQEDEEETTSTS